MLIIAYLVSMDATANGENGTMWFFVVLFLPMMGLFAYLLVRTINNNPRRISISNSNYSNLGTTTPPMTEPVRSKRPIANYESEFPKTTGQELMENQFCTSCGFKNSIHASFCKSCGVKLT